jgi:hypothetical protein
MLAIAPLGGAARASERAATTFERLYPFGAPARVRHVLGRPKNRITFGLEAEFPLAKTAALLHWYRPPEIPDQRWDPLPIDQRLEMAGLGIGMVPTRHAPAALQQPLTKDVGGLELVTEPLDSLEAAFGELDRAEAMVGGDGQRRSRSFYWQGNVVLTRDPTFTRTQRKGILGYLKATADYAQLRKLHLAYLHHLEDPTFIPAKNLQLYPLGPLDRPALAHEHEELDASSKGEGRKNFLFHNVQGTYFRTWAYGDGRDGFEVRDAHKEVAHLKLEMRRLTHALENGFGAYQRFRSVRVLTRGMFFGLRRPVQDMMFRIVADYFTVPYRFVFPLRPLEEDYARALRLPNPEAEALRDRVRTARAAYLATLERLVPEAGKNKAAALDQMSIAIGKFAYETGLYPLLDEAFARGAEHIEQARGRR